MYLRTHPTWQLLSLTLGLPLFFALSTSTDAKAFKPKVNEVENYKDVIFGLMEMRENIDTVECGGWKEDSDGTANGEDVSGYVPLPDVSPDVPGRRNVDALGQPTVGVGERSQFEYPDSAFGYSSACDVDRQTEIIDPDLQKHGIPGVKWQWSGNFDDDVQFVPNAPGVIEINPFRWCILKDTSSPRICEKLYKTLRKLATVVPRPPPDTWCTMPPAGCPAGIPVVGYPPLMPKRYCFDYPPFTTTAPGYTFECHGTSGPTPTPRYTTDPDTPPQQETCRTPWYPEFYNKMIECHGIVLTDPDGNPFCQTIIDVGSYHTALSSSFYRHYGNPFSDWAQVKNPGQSPLTVTTPDGQLWKLRGECYEYYASPVTHQEEDPKDRVMGIEREQCEVVVLTDDEQAPKKPEWEDGSGKQKDKVKADAAMVQEAARASRDIPDPWLADTESNLTIIDGKKLSKLQQSLDDPFDITGIMSTILPIKMRASKMVPKHARTDITSDDAERAFGEFWEGQQMELQKMVTDPATRLIMPARFLLGLADDDPVYQYVQNIVSRSDGTVAITLRSGAEDIWNVLTSFLRVYVAPIQRVRIPVLVPLASENEITTLIFQWQQWKEEETRFANVPPGRASNAAMADPIIAKLEGYLTRIHEARRLRAAEAKYLTKLFDLQSEVRTYAADWYEDNSKRLQQAAERGVQRRELREVWRRLQETMLKTDESQLNWCSNHRYSLAVYSLLDLPEVWWGDGPPYSFRDPLFTPPDLRDLNYEQPEDAEYEFSDMKFSREPLLTPELWFIEAEVKLPRQPLPGSKPPDPSTIADLPQMPDIDIFDSLTVPDVSLPPPDLIEVPPPPADLTEAISKMEDFARRMDRMYAAYKRFQPSFTDLPDPEQKRGNLTKIIHVENDLKERIARAFSRWLPERKVDYAGRVARLNEDGFEQGGGKCFEDVVCYFLPPEKEKLITWQWFTPKATGDELTGKSNELRGMTVPPEAATEDENPFDSTVPTLRRLFPSFDLPLLIDLQIPEPTTP